MRVVQQTCAFLACLVMVISCGGGGTSTGDGTPGERPLEPEIPETMDPQEQIPVSVQLSDSNQETAQGKTVIFDYSGPELNEEDLTVRVGDTEVPALLSETQIYILLPLSESGETTATFEFPGDKTASVQLNIAEAPTIENPEVYVSDQVTEVFSMFESLRDEYPDVWELLEQAQDQIAGLSEDEAQELAILFKQNIEPLLDTPEISEVDAMGFEETGSLEFAAVRSSGGLNNPVVSQTLLGDLCPPAEKFIKEQGLAAAAIATFAISIVTPGWQPLAIAALIIILDKAEKIKKAAADIRDDCLFGRIRVALEGISSNSQTHFFSESSAVAAARFQSSEVVSQGSEATDRIIFTDGESRTVSVNLDSTIQYDRRSVLLEAYDAFRNLLVNTNDKLESLGETLGLELSFQNLIDSFPTSLESSEPADTSDFEIDVPSPYLNVKGEITARERGKLTLLFSFPLGPPIAEDHSDFEFVLTDGDGDPIRVSARLLAAEDVSEDCVDIVEEIDGEMFVVGQECPENHPHSLLFQAVIDGDIDAVNALIAEGVDPNIQDNNGFTPLDIAASLGDVDILKALIAAGAEAEAYHVFDLINAGATLSVEDALFFINAGGDIDATDGNGRSFLHYAVYDNRIDLVNVLIDAGADLNIKEDEFGRTPLHAAAGFGYTDIVRALIDAGANLNIQDDDGVTALDLAIGGFTSSPGPHTDIVNMLKAAGALCNTTCEQNYENLLDAVSAGGLEAVIALIDAGADLNIQDDEGETPLHAAASEENADIAKVLIDAGADLNIQDDRGRTPLHAAVIVQSIDITRALIDAGADLNVQGDFDRTPLHYAVYDNRIDLVNVLIDAGADLNIQEDRGLTPLHAAVIVQSIDITRVLANAVGAPLNVQEGLLGWTPLHRAAFDGNADIAEVLIDAGADLNIQNNRGGTPLHEAANDGNADTVEVLIDAGADLNIQNNFDQTPLDVAVANGYTTIVNVLKAAGAVCNTTC